jgi:hypothetical protein
MLDVLHKRMQIPHNGPEIAYRWIPAKKAALITYTHTHTRTHDPM